MHNLWEVFVLMTPKSPCLALTSYTSDIIPYFQLPTGYGYQLRSPRANGTQIILPISFLSKFFFFNQLYYYYSNLAHLKFYEIVDSSSSAFAPKACELLPEPSFSLPPHWFHPFPDFFPTPPQNPDPSLYVQIQTTHYITSSVFLDCYSLHASKGRLSAAVRLNISLLALQGPDRILTIQRHLTQNLFSTEGPPEHGVHFRCPRKTSWFT